MTLMWKQKKNPKCAVGCSGHLSLLSLESSKRAKNFISLKFKGSISLLWMLAKPLTGNSAGISNVNDHAGGTETTFCCLLCINVFCRLDTLCRGNRKWRSTKNWNHFLLLSFLLSSTFYLSIRICHRGRKHEGKKHKYLRLGSILPCFFEYLSITINIITTSSRQ